jgi:hypothetical protein
VRYYVPETQELYFDNNETGETETVFRSYWTTVENAVNHYGRAAMHGDILRTYDEEEAGERTFSGASSMKLLHAVFLRRTGKPDSLETAGNKKWASVTVDIKNRHVIRESGYDEFPYALFFWEKTNKPYGISPTIKAANDIALYQTAMEETLRVAQLSANPPKIVPDKYRGKENFNPGGISYVRSMDAVPQQLNMGDNFPITLEVTRMLSQNIKEWYNVDFFLMLRQYQNVQNMTATAVAALQGEQAALLSALVANLFEGLDRIIQRTFNILAKRRMLPPLPFALREAGGALKVDFQGVLAQAQKAAYEYAGIEDVLSIASEFMGFAKADPNWGKAVNWLNPETVFKKAIESRGAPAGLLRTREEYARFIAGIEEKEEAMAARQAQAAESQALLQNAKNLNQPVQPDSMLSGMLGTRR